MTNLELAKQAIIAYRDSVKQTEGEITQVIQADALKAQLLTLGYESVDEVFAELKDTTVPVCTRCGECCYIKYGVTIESADKEDTIEFLKQYDAKIEERPDNKLYVSYKFPCSQLSFDENGLAVCNIQQTKPKMCQGYYCRDVLTGLK